MQAAASRSVMLTLAPTVGPSFMTFRSNLRLNVWKAPRNSRDHLTRLVSLWGARAPAVHASLSTRTTTQIVAQECTVLLQFVHPQAFSLILTSVSLFQLPHVPS